MPLALGQNASQGDIIYNINYLMSTLGQGINTVSLNSQTGVISNPYTTFGISYAYQYINIRYATNSTGTENFSTSCTNATYYGLRNTQDAAPLDDSNPANYVWFEANPAYGIGNFMFYSAIGGRQIVFAIAPMAPTAAYQIAPAGVPVNLDVVTNVVSASANSAITAGTVTGNIQGNINQLGTLTFLNVTGNVNSANYIGGGSRLNNLNAANIVGTVANAAFASTCNIANFATVATYANTAGAADSANTATSANTAVTVTGNAQANITSLGTLTSVTVGVWNISLTPTNGLLFSTGGANRMVLNSNGNLIVSGNVIPNGTVI